MVKNQDRTLDPLFLSARMRFIASLRNSLESLGYLEVETPMLHPTLSGFEQGTGFRTFSASVGERFWFRAAPELYLKRLLVDWSPNGPNKVFEIARCLRDELRHDNPRDNFDRPEVTLLELYAPEADHWYLESLLRRIIKTSLDSLSDLGVLPSGEAGMALNNIQKDWKRQKFGDLLSSIDPDFNLENRIANKQDWTSDTQHAKAIESRAGDAQLLKASTNLAYKAGSLHKYLRQGPQGYWYDFIDHAFKQKVVPTLNGPTTIYDFPLESSPLAQSDDGVHCLKWELYVGGILIALAQRELMDAKGQKIRFQHLANLRRRGYQLMPEPDESFLNKLDQWPQDRPLVGMGIYIDRLIGLILDLVGPEGQGQDRMNMAMQFSCDE